MIWLIPIALLIAALAGGGARTFGPRPGLAKREIPKDTRFVIWVDDALSAAVYLKDSEWVASVTNGETIEQPVPDLDTDLFDALRLAEFSGNTVRYESLLKPHTFVVHPAAGEWQWVASKGPAVTSGVTRTRAESVREAISFIMQGVA